jgi:hypothetical protein
LPLENLDRLRAQVVDSGAWNPADDVLGGAMAARALKDYGFR